MGWRPATVGLYRTEQLALALPGAVALRSQLAKVARLRSALKVTVPVGVVAGATVVLTVSVTVAVHVVVLPAWTGEGSQFTIVVVGWIVAVTTAEPVLISWVASPPYVAVMVCRPTAA